MRGISVVGAVLLAIVVLVPSHAVAYSEWQTISSRLTKISEQAGAGFDCDLKSHRGDVHFRENVLVSSENLGTFMKAMLNVGNYLNENTNAGQSYQIFVHFDDRVRSISVSDLLALGKKAGRAPGIREVTEFLNRFHPE